MRRTVIVLTIIAAMGLLAACDDGSGTASAWYSHDDYVDAIMEDFSTDDLPIDRQQARCFAGETIDAFGVSVLNNADITPKELVAVPDIATLSRRVGGAPARRRVRAAVLEDRCFAIADLLEDQFATALPASLSDQQVRCIAEHAAQVPAVRESFGDLLAGGDYDEARLGDAIDADAPGAIAACGVGAGSPSS